MARELGYASPNKMLAEMSGDELQDWRAYFALKDEERRQRDLDAKGKANLRIAR